jgi:ketosteroid isomerase-like protein
MPERGVAQNIIGRLHAARVSNDLAGMVAVFATHGRFRILGASADKPIAIESENLTDFTPWLAMLVKAFRINHYDLMSLTVEWPRAIAHWRADIYSKITGVTVPTELVDIVEVSDERIVAYTEFFAPR